MEEEDKRFSHIGTDPKFRRIPKAHRKVKIDKRFKSMFKEKQFKVKYTVDKRGRPTNHTTNEDLKRYYELSSGDESSDSEQIKETNEPSQASKEPEEESSDLDIKIKEDQTIPNTIREKLKNLNVDYARGESKLLSDTSSSDDESVEDQDEELEHAWGELDKDAETTEEPTKRLAACNMDWDRIRSIDIMVLLTSFLPAGGFIESVKIYPSDFGLQRMQEEEIKGPTELVESKLEENEEENEDGPKYHMEKLRQYQLNRLKYYYAVITFDSPTSANKIYTECDGMEYESSAIKLDLRFIPDEMTFEQEPKEVCDKVPEEGKYQPRFFTTTALQQAKVNLTWDETDLERIEVTQKFSNGNLDVNDEDVRNYLASSSGEETDENPEEIKENANLNSLDKYKSLLQDIEKQEQEKQEKEVQMEVTWGLDLQEKTKELVKKKLESKVDKTPFEEYLDKRKEKRKAKKEMRKTADEENSDSDLPSDVDMNDPYFAEEFNKPEFKKKTKAKHVDVEEEEQNNELELLLDEDDGKKHFSLKKIQKLEEQSNKKKNKLKATEVEKDNFAVDVEDQRFSALFSSHHFNIDPTDPHYKKTKGMEALINEKLKRRIHDDEDREVKSESSVKKDAELNVLVKSIKRKTEELKNKKRKVKL